VLKQLIQWLRKRQKAYDLEKQRLRYGGLENFKDSSVCRHCGEIYGSFELTNKTGHYYQECGCEKEPEMQLAKYNLEKPLNLDFGQIVTLCYCCGQELLRGGSKWSVFFCDFCKEQILAINRTFGLALIPIGRHSLMNSIVLESKDTFKEKKIREFSSALSSLFERIGMLHEWKRIMVSNQFKKMGQSEKSDIGLESYLAKMPRTEKSKSTAVVSLLNFFLQQCSRSKEDESVSGKDAESEIDLAGENAPCFYNPEKEFKCVFFTLVIRNQALENKYPGGHIAYPIKYGGEYNDQITLNSFMAPEFDEEIEDLEQNGLIANEDYLLFDVGILPHEIEDYTPFKTSVSWFSGYYKKGSIIIKYEP
jgi:hypothetical protein